MRTGPFLSAMVLLQAAAAPALARNTIEASDDNGGGSSALQCVPYARQATGIRLYGDAHTWWAQAEGRYERGSRPETGAVMAIRPHGNSRLGHVAAVSRVIDSRRVLLSHANWSAPGLIEENVEARDVSPENDWSEVRIWFGPSQSLGANHWPLYGFIYNGKPGSKESRPRAKNSAPSRSDDLIADIIAGRVR